MLKRIFHWGPLLALGIIKVVSWTTIKTTSKWLPLTGSALGTMNALIFFSLAFLTVYNFITTIAVGPGYVPLKWHPKKTEDEQCLQFCVSCDGFKVPRSHHCRKCGRCILKMDHHCPWINNCVGHHNHSYFTLFLFFAICGSIHSCILLIITLYKVFVPSSNYVNGLIVPIKLSVMSFILCVFSIGMSLGVCLALSFLLYMQVKSILFNRTGIEDWILEKAEERRHIDPSISPFIYPYDLGWYKNTKQVFSSSCTPEKDGIEWEIREGCSKYDLTIEQLKQKQLKKIRKKPFKVIRKYSGAIFPVVNGVCACLRPPYSTESRMPLKVDDVILVTRYQKYWLFGEKNFRHSPDYCKGWFPRSCVIPITEYECYKSQNKLTKKEL